MSDRSVRKDDVRKEVGGDQGHLRRYQDFFVGERGLGALVKYELAHILAAHTPGAPGYVLRKLMMIPLLGSAGDGIQIGKGVTFRHPGKISIGDQTAIDDLCVLDARGVESGEFHIGAEVLIARGTAMTAKTDHGEIEIGDHSTIGKNCILSSSGGIRIGKWVGIGGDCYLGGGRYSTGRTDVPMMEQDVYTEGPVVIGDDCWIGAGARILDGVQIGRGSVIGAGAVVREDVSEYTVVAPHQRHAQFPRAAKETAEPREVNGKSQDEERRAQRGNSVATGRKKNGIATSQKKNGVATSREENGVTKGKNAIQGSVYRAIDTLNRTRPSEERLAKSPETSLEALDSIDKVNLIVETESEIKRELGQSVSLTNNAEGRGSRKGETNPFKTVASFTEYVASQLNSRS
jgi:acetyltransferase-like isoleucine patch superfamily enzyme